MTDSPSDARDDSRVDVHTAYDRSPLGKHGRRRQTDPSKPHDRYPYSASL